MLNNDTKFVPKTKQKPKGMGQYTPKIIFQSILRQKILILLKYYDSSEVDSRTWVHVPLGLSDPPVVTLTR